MSDYTFYMATYVCGAVVGAIMTVIIMSALQS